MHSKLLSKAQCRDITKCGQSGSKAEAAGINQLVPIQVIGGWLERIGQSLGICDIQWEILQT